jgi:uncharacterized DUF497 family protein
MQDDAFEWDDEKAHFNVQKHRITFEAAREAFDDPNRVEEPDDDMDEERWKLTGRAADKLLVVIYTERNGRFRIISAR